MKKLIKSRLVAIHGSKVMLLKKKGPKQKYTLPGGIKKKKETEVQALVRETSEEIALHLATDQVYFYLSLTSDIGQETIIKNYFYTHLKPREISVKEMHKFDSVIWLDWKMAKAYTDRSDRLAITAYFKNIQKKDKKTKKDERTIPPCTTL